MRYTLFIVFVFIGITKGFTQNVKIIDAYSFSSCNNEDFESSPYGLITSSTAVQGWTVKRLVNSGSTCNSNLFSSPFQILNPDNGYAEVIATTTGIIDANIGPSYTIFSVFGGETPNLGGSQDPEIGQMYGSTFFKVNNGGPLNRNHSLEKTFLVTPSNALFRFAFLPVVNPKIGVCCEQPGVYITFINSSSSNTVLPCSSYSVTGPSPVCTNQSSPAINLTVCPNNSQFYFQKWKIFNVDLSDYIGSNITFKLGGFDCVSGCLYHSYAYVDAQCSEVGIKVNGNNVSSSLNSYSYNVCSNTSFTIDAPPFFSSYSWMGPSSFTSTNSTIVTTLPGTYTLSYNSFGSCTPLYKFITINTFPNSALTISPSTSLICVGSNATLTVNGAVSYSLNNQPTSAPIVVSPSVTSVYTVTGVDNNSCSLSNTVSITVSQCVGLNSNSLENKFVRVHPNPSNGEVVMTLEKSNQPINIFIYDSLGRFLFQKTLMGEESAFEISNLSKGIYIYRCIDAKGNVDSGKIIINSVDH